VVASEDRRAVPDMAGAVQALAVLNELQDAPLSGVVLVSKAPGQPATITQLQPTPMAAGPLSKVTTAATKRLIVCEVVDYEPAATVADGQVMWLSLDSVAVLKQLLADSEDLANLELFNPKRHNVVELELAAMRVEAGGTAAIYVQSLRGSQVVARSTKVGLVIRRGVLDVPHGDVIMLNSDVSAVITGDYVFFRNRSAFQQLFGLLDEIRKQAAATFATVTAGVRIDGIEEMAQVVTGSPAMLGKMASIQRKLNKYPKYRESLTMDNIVKFARAHPEYGVSLIGNGANTRLVFRKDPQTRFKILKLLDDDFLRSELTTLEYEANSKSFPLQTK
jgi:Kiwa KwaB-like protein